MGRGQLFSFFKDLAEIVEIAPTRKKTNELATFSCHARGIRFSDIVSLFLSFSLSFQLLFFIFSVLCVLSTFFETFLPDALFFSLLALMRLQHECKGGATQLKELREWVSGPPGERISQRSLILLY